MTHTELKPGKLKLSTIVAGAWRMADWNWNPQDRLHWIEQCIERGVTSFDHADIYGNYSVEGLFGEALALNPELRNQMQLVSKCGIKLISDRRPEHRIKSYDHSKKHIIWSVENSLRELRTDRLDLLLLHRPSPLMQADEVAEAFSELQQQGKVLAFGVSNFTPHQFDLLNSRFELVTNQIELSPLHLDPLHDGTLDQLQKERVAPMVWSPLAQGRIFTDSGERSVRVRLTLERLANEHGVSVATLVYAWILKHPSRPLPITGSQRMQVINEAVQALNVQLSEQDWFEVWQASQGHEVP
ncbi:aldo/keto reductase [Deinococcus cellulosilyticus]|uniref:Oxidoreductase n=1 Tax=Deinococcus cellulosilyticus (strain DSM 18568 / NBRC 106333 / KACC 11606 / 5516J-15) TaxID=1223518 RepID=A0A511N123_DEIC1|nr:aldo/keto reductase [Deinococcus cellulosilyticus]GEM46157.1 oxidoreductase [Deinococcus cellulosilyticus NBRC 106333 = KACC 11606]